MVGLIEKMQRKLVRYHDKRVGEPDSWEMPQATYNELYDICMADVDVEVDKTKDRPYDPKNSLFGIPIKLNNRMKDGNWRLNENSLRW